jgi:hypothetical protein
MLPPDDLHAEKPQEKSKMHIYNHFFTLTLLLFSFGHDAIFALTWFAPFNLGNCT